MALDYEGSDNFILTAEDGTTSGGIAIDIDADRILINDATDNKVKMIKPSYLRNIYSWTVVGDGAANPQVINDGNTLEILGSTGMDVQTASSSTSVLVALDYSGGDSFIMAATNGTGITVDGANDKLVIYDNDAAEVKYINANQLGGGSMSSFNVDADSGSAIAIADGDTVDIAGGTGIATARSTVGTKTDIEIVLNASINDLSDVNASPSTNDVLTWSGSKWGAAAPSSGTNFNIQADSGGSTAIADGDTIDIAGGTAMDTVNSSGTVSVNLDLGELSTGTNNDADFFRCH